MQKKEDIKKLITLICEGIGIALGVAVVVLNMIDQLQVKEAISMLGIGMFCIGLSLISRNQD